MDAQTFFKQYSVHKRQFPWINLINVNLTEA